MSISEQMVDLIILSASILKVSSLEMAYLLYLFEALQSAKILDSTSGLDAIASAVLFVKVSFVQRVTNYLP